MPDMPMPCRNDHDEADARHAAADLPPAPAAGPVPVPSPPFRFVSLGSDCQPARQINRIQPSNISGVFDWVTTQIQHIGRLIENDFAGFLEPDNMFPVFHDQVFVGLVDTLYRVGFNHDFTRLDAADVSAVRDIYRMRIRWFRNLFDPRRPPPYFIRRQHPRDGVEDESLAIALFEQLRAKRGDIRFLYLHADPGRREFMTDGYRSAFLRQMDPFEWLGDNEAWNAILGGFAVRPFPGDRAAFPLPDYVPQVRRPRFR